MNFYNVYVSQSDESDVQIHGHLHGPLLARLPRLLGVRVNVRGARAPRTFPHTQVFLSQNMNT